MRPTRWLHGLSQPGIEVGDNLGDSPGGFVLKLLWVCSFKDGQGEIEASLLTEDADLQQRIETNPGLRWKALNVKTHIGGN